MLTIWLALYVLLMREKRCSVSNSDLVERIEKGYGDLDRDSVRDLVKDGKWSVQENPDRQLVVRNESGHIVKGSRFPTSKMNENMKLLRTQLMDQIMEEGHADLWYGSLMQAVQSRDAQALTIWRDTFLGKPSEVQEEVDVMDVVALLQKSMRVVDVA